MPNIVGHLVLNEVPRQSDDMVIAQIPFRTVPGEQTPLQVQYGVVPAPLRYILVLYPVHAALFWRAFRSGLTFQSISQLRQAYRLLYAVIGLATIGALILQ